MKRGSGIQEMHLSLARIAAVSVCLMQLAACTQTTLPTPTSEPTPDTEATVVARVQATVEALPSPTPAVVPTLKPTTTPIPPMPTPDTEATVVARVQATVEALPSPTPAVVPTLKPTTTPIPPTPSPTATPQWAIRVVSEDENGALELEALALTYHDLLSDLLYIGVVSNKGSRTLPGVSVTFRFRNEAMKMEIDTRSASVLLRGEIGSDELVPFIVGLPESKQGEDWDTVEVTLAVEPFGALFATRIDGLEVTQIERQPDGLSGTIVNSSNRTVGGTAILEGLEVAVIGYDNAGEVVVVGNDTISRALEPGWTTTFRLGGMFSVGLYGKLELATSYYTRVLAKGSD